MWNILTHPDRRDGGWTADEFFATGRGEIDHAIEHLNGLGVEFKHGRALDFGEGAGTDIPPSCAADFPEAEALTDDAESSNFEEAAPAFTEPTPTTRSTDRLAAPTVPPVPHAPEQSAWCILVCHHCRRSQRVSVVGDQAAIRCLFCNGVFSPGLLSRQRRADWR